MKAERFVLSFIAVLIGLLVAGGAFYLYQMTKKPETNNAQTISIKSATPTPSSTIPFSLDNPKDEEVINTKTVTISGRTVKDAVIIASAPTNDTVVKPSSDGNFSLTVTIGDGVTPIQVTAIFPNGEEKKIIRSVAYSNEDF